MLEGPLRDLLASDLSVLEAELTLLDVEAYIPGSIATRSFIDILAKDERGRWVLIEIKRSDASAREAIHEIYKYVEAVKEHLGVRDDEIRAIVASTEWRELLVPFSRFAQDTSISVYGARLSLDSLTNKIVAERVEPLPMTSGRVLSPWHEISLYKSKQRLEEGIASYDASCRAKGINDYVMVLLKARDDFYEMSVRVTAQALRSIRGETGDVTAEEVRETATKMDRLDHMIYFVPHLQSAEVYLEIIRGTPSLYEEAKDFSSNMEGDELLSSLQSYALDAKPNVTRDYLEIGYPAKFRTKIIEDEGWTIEKVLRRGAFARNAVLSNDTILGEIGGDSGTSGQRLKRSIFLSDKAEMSQLLRDLGECLPNNPVWSDAIRGQLEDSKKDFSTGTADISIFAPSTGLFTIFFAATREEGLLYVPTYSLVIKDRGRERRIYIGELAPVADKSVGAMKFTKILAKYYSNDIGALLMLMSAGGYETRDVDILEDANLQYTSVRCDLDGDRRSFYRKKNGRWKQIGPVTPFGEFERYFQNSADLVRAIVQKIGPRMMPGMWDGSPAKVRLRDAIAPEVVKKDQYYSGDVGPCEVCGVALSSDEFISSGPLRVTGKQACMCADCTIYFGDHFQGEHIKLFQKQRDERWLLVADPMQPLSM